MAGNLDAPEGIRREPKAYEDDDGAVRSERSGPQSWAPASQPARAQGDLRSAQPAPTEIPPANPKKQKKPTTSRTSPTHIPKND